MCNVEKIPSPSWRGGERRPLGFFFFFLPLFLFFSQTQPNPLGSPIHRSRWGSRAMGGNDALNPPTLAVAVAVVSFMWAFRAQRISTALPRGGKQPECRPS